MSGGQCAGADRFQHLQSLVTEFQDTDSTESPFIQGVSAIQDSTRLDLCAGNLRRVDRMYWGAGEDAKEQVLANLANFSYDPKNLTHLRQLQVPDLFLDMLSEDNETLVEFGIGGLCNLCLDKATKSHILASGGLSLVIDCLASQREETVLSAITTLMYLSTSTSREQITTRPVIECMLRFSLSVNRRLSNLANVFLEDYCTEKEVQEARALNQHSALGIPLPED